MGDDGFHEIQVGKKQLVFLFMAAAVFSVVVFLIGVWVGRDVRFNKRADAEVAADVPTADVSPDVQQPPTQVSPKDLDYNARVQTGAAKPDDTEKPSEPPTPPAESGPPEPTPTPASTPAAVTKAAPAPEPAAKAAPAGAFHLQVGAFSTRKPADTLVGKLVKKGYAAYLVTVTSGPTRFRVQVGPYADRAAAQAASDRLKKEERLSPLVQR